jgi:hypothetical protein
LPERIPKQGRVPETFRIEVADQYGAVALVIDPPATTARQRARLDELAGQAIRGMAKIPGIVNEDHAREILLSELGRQHADQLAYERVAEQRGVLPL